MGVGGGIAKITNLMYLPKFLSLLAQTLHLTLCSLSCKVFKFIVILVSGWWHQHKLCWCSKKLDYFFWGFPAPWIDQNHITSIIFFENKDRPYINLGKYQCNVMPHVFAFLNCCSNWELLIAAETIELEIYKTYIFCVSRSLL